MNFYKKNFFILFIFSLFLFFSYMPILFGEYLFSDTYNLVYPKLSNNNNDNFFIVNYEKLFDVFVNRYGRPLTLYYFILINKLVLGPSDALYFRLIAIFLIISIYIYMVKILNNLNIPFNHSVALAALIVTTPAFLIHSYWLVMISGLLSVFFAICAYESLEDLELNKKKLHKIFFSSFFLILSLLIYQQNTTFFLLLTFLGPIYSFLNAKKINLKYFFFKNFVFIISFILHIFILKIYYNAKLGQPELSLAGIYYKFLWFFTEIIPLAINFFYFNVNIFFLFFLLFLIFFFSNKKFKSIKLKLSFAFFLCCVIFVASALFFFPVLVTGSYLAGSHRIILTLSSFFIIIIYFLIKFSFKLRKIFTFFLFVLLFAVLVKNFFILNFYVSKPQTREYQLIKSILKENIKSNTNKIYFIRPARNQRVSPFLTNKLIRGVEMGYLSSAIESNAAEMILVALEDLKINYRLVYDKNISIKSFSDKLEIDKNNDIQKNVLVINFSNYPNISYQID